MLIAVSVCLSVSSFSNLNKARGRMRRGQRTFRPDNKEERQYLL